MFFQKERNKYHFHLISLKFDWKKYWIFQSFLKFMNYQNFDMNNVLMHNIYIYICKKKYRLKGNIYIQLWIFPNLVLTFFLKYSVLIWLIDWRRSFEKEQGSWHGAKIVEKERESWHDAKIVEFYSFSVFIFFTYYCYIDIP